MLSGSLFPRGGGHLLLVAVGNFLDAIAPDRENPPADHSAGLHLEWASLDHDLTLGASWFASEPHDSHRDWNHLGAADLLWFPLPRLELSSEVVFGEGSRTANGTLWGLYAQAVLETLDTLYAVGRYERFDPPGADAAIDLVDLGLTWVPRHFLRLKADYLLANRSHHDFAEPGLRASFSILF